LVVVHEALIKARNRGRLSPVIVADEFDGAPEETTPTIDVVRPDAVGEPR
jgi:hypothetical protein